MTEVVERRIYWRLLINTFRRTGKPSGFLVVTLLSMIIFSNLPEGIRPQLLSLIETVFSYDKANAQCLVLDILACVRQKHLVQFHFCACLIFY